MANTIVNDKKFEIKSARLLTADEFIEFDSAIPQSVVNAATASVFYWKGSATARMWSNTNQSYEIGCEDEDALVSGQLFPVIVFQTENDITVGEKIEIKGQEFQVISDNLAIATSGVSCHYYEGGDRIFYKSLNAQFLKEWFDSLVSVEKTSILTESEFNDKVYVNRGNKTRIEAINEIRHSLSDFREFEQSEKPIIIIDEFKTLVKYIPSVGVTDIVLPEGIEAIANEAFALNENKKVEFNTIHLPKTLRYIESGTFAGINTLEKITVDNDNVCFTEQNGVLFGCKKTSYIGCVVSDDNKEIEAIICYPAGKTDIKAFAMPPEVIYVEKYAFSGSCLETIKAKNKNLILGDKAFDNCVKLKTIEFPAQKQIKFNGTAIFEGCINDKTSIKFSTKKALLKQGGVISEDGKILYYACLCNGNEFVIPEGVEQIEKGAFSSNLRSPVKKITFPNSYTYIEDGLCYGNVELQEVILGSSTQFIGNDAFCSCYSLYNLENAENLTCIGATAFNGADKLSKITLGANCRFPNGLYGCPELVIEAPKGSKTIENAKCQGVKYKEL